MKVSLATPKPIRVLPVATEAHLSNVYVDLKTGNAAFALSESIHPTPDAARVTGKLSDKLLQLFRDECLQLASAHVGTELSEFVEPPPPAPEQNDDVEEDPHPTRPRS